MPSGGRAAMLLELMGGELTAAAAGRCGSGREAGVWEGCEQGRW